MKHRNIMVQAAAVMLLLAGLLCLLYPFYANFLFSVQADGIITAYRNTAVSENDWEELLSEAEAYNEQLASGQIRLYDPFSQEGKEHLTQYEQLLRISDDGMMGVIRVPQLDIRLPVFHGTDAETLEKGAGHLSGTSLPVGGRSTHTVITGHTGLSGAKLFTDLIQIREGDLILLETVGRELAYRVTDIYVVEPSDLSKLYIVPGEDLLTLVTCTPYGVNTHRLLVRGERTGLSEVQASPDASMERSGFSSEWMRQYKQTLAAGGILLLLILGVGLLVCNHKGGHV